MSARDEAVLGIAADPRQGLLMWTRDIDGVEQEITFAEILAAVRRSAITEAVDRLTDAQIERLVVRMMGLTSAQSRAALRRALTEGT
jgi:hypothetical protein